MVAGCATLAAAYWIVIWPEFPGELMRHVAFFTLLCGGAALFFSISGSEVCEQVGYAIIFGQVSYPLY